MSKGTGIGPLRRTPNAQQHPAMQHLFGRPSGRKTVALNISNNAFQVAIDAAGTGCWAVEVSYAQIELPFSIGQTVADATADVTIRQSKTDTVIGG
jgi:hypothetical protein